MAIEVEFRRERETKNTIRFEEVESESGDPPVIGSLYLQKWAVKRLGDPQKLKVMVDAN
jgi:hypothetical protein